VIILNAPSAVITAVTTSITLSADRSKWILQAGDGTAMMFVVALSWHQVAPDGTTWGEIRP
jgi:hypothetical protein